MEHYLPPLFYKTAYSVCIILHFAALWYSLRTWISYGQRFIDVKGGVKRYFNSQMERRFMVVCLGTICNLYYIPTVLSYIVFHNAYTTDALEINFVATHFFGSLFSLAVHLWAFCDTKMEDNNAKK